MPIYHEANNPDDIALGRALISGGKVGCLVLAGGDGSRLGWKGPKGTFPLSLVKQKTLFQMLADRLEAAGRFYGKKLRCAVMASPNNEEITRSALPKDVGIFLQKVIPLLDEKKQEIPELRPNGNGEVLHRFYESSYFQEWKNEGITHVQVILIDNPLAEPFDPNQIGVHFKTSADITLKVIERSHERENVGVVGMQSGKLCVIEYSENPPLDWNLANTSLFSFSMEFIEKIQHVKLPEHEVRRFIGQKPVYKRECFIFDLLTYTEKTELILYPRHETFAPLKNRDDVGAVQQALLERDRRLFHALTRQKLDHIFELDAQFHYPTSELKEKWKDASPPTRSYIEP